MSIEYKTNTASQIQIQNILQNCDKFFIPKLSEKVNINEYAKKIFDHAIRFEAWDVDTLIAIIAMYINKEDENKTFGYITNVCVVNGYNNKGIASNLLTNCIEYATQDNLFFIELEVDKNNSSAINLYSKFKFLVKREENFSKFMSLELKRKN